MAGSDSRDGSGAADGATEPEGDGAGEETDRLPTVLVVAGIGALCCLGLPVVGGVAVTGGVAVGGVVGNVVAGVATAVTLGAVLLGARLWARRR